ncbi:leishmanolysin-like peptidase [Paragonimus westermani]|uniref:Leishmanolysin-like peptidase n=1 Tax=Paragonimus westermani TaxID=34504 RepID=A0A5J4NS83_9TREM|nr:leishmanolysin-like peptidase [Paragonimus westermani]
MVRIKLLCLLILYVFSRILLIASATVCLHSFEDPTSIVTRVSLPGRRRISRQAANLSLHIHVHYDESVIKVREFEDIRKNILNVAVDFWQRALSLRHPRTYSHLVLDRRCVGGQTRLQAMNHRPLTVCMNGCPDITTCGPIRIPNDHLNRCRFISNGSYVLSGPQGRGLLDTDFVLYISSLPTNRCETSKVLGYAAHCQTASHTDRPIAGYINFCPNVLKHESSDRVRSLFIAKHELLHALGFSSSLFAMYRDENNQPLTPRDPNTQLPSLGWSQISSNSVYQWSDRVVRTVQRRWLSAYGNRTKLAHIVVTPTVLRVARAFFDCPTLDGVELEDQDEAGVFLTHWEKRLLENELMTATYTNSYRISPITLAMMEDTGWYRANYAMSHDFSWGRGLGCSFAMSSCLEYMLEQKKLHSSIDPFCQQIQPPPDEADRIGVQVSCTPDGVSYGFCNLVTHSKPLPPEFVYFVRPITSFSPTNVELGGGDLTGRQALDNVGGKIALANYCPYYQEIEWERRHDEPAINTHCHAADNFKVSCIVFYHYSLFFVLLFRLSEPEFNFKLERFTHDAICVQHGTGWRLSNGQQAYALPVEGAGCYTFRCSLAEGGLVIELAGGMAIPCVVPGRPVHVKACITSKGLAIDGQLICPDCRLLCDPTDCPSLLPEYSRPLIVRPASFSRRPVRTHPSPFQGLYPVNGLIPNVKNETTDTYFKQSSILYRKALYSRKQEITPGKCGSRSSPVKSAGFMGISRFVITLCVTMCTHFSFCMI